ncbi:tRNA:m(4)X modification enzyme TRM13 homolog isoform X2 [Dreissena polymorpha]|uniref:tRNA:m(4)X modification enzyme TRM13 homolog isoform X2 n=1 Tax=Dreissena polymorpha TaxID=45954 RepID=UPI002264F31A|nr:tRNA:m(4)X modification enzyme TRM13 homolog isoform X2 [Dreissena polymorpha]
MRNKQKDMNTVRGTYSQAKPDPPANSCHFFVERKRRYCRFHLAKGSNYCAEHAAVLGVDLRRKRVQCPYNPKHTCYETKLNHHKKVCPSQPKQMPPYYCKGVNSGDDGGESVPEPKETVLTIPLEDLDRIISKVNQLHDEHVGVIEEDVLSHDCMKAELENPSYGNAAIRHRKQQASLIGHMEKLCLLTDGKCFLEMGAGKGQLSHWLHGAVEKKDNIGFLLIDRSRVRNKMDNLHKEEMIMERIRIDIEHLRLDKVPCISENDRSVVAFGKHLCGAASDLALRCITETLKPGTSCQEGEEEEGNHRKRLKSESRELSGAVIALCCHHRCTWHPYVGKHFFQSQGLTARDFQVVSSMSSWATCAWKGWSAQKKFDMDNINSQSPSASGEYVIDELRRSENSASLNVLAAQGVGSFEDYDVESQGNVKDVSGEGQKGNCDNKDGSTEVKGNAMKSDIRKDLENDDDIEEVEHCQDENTTNSSIQGKLTQAEREMIGRKCKRLIDYGRVCFLREHGLESSLKAYVEEFYTPENVVLLASK